MKKKRNKKGKRRTLRSGMGNMESDEDESEYDDEDDFLSELDEAQLRDEDEDDEYYDEEDDDYSSESPRMGRKGSNKQIAQLSGLAKKM